MSGAYDDTGARSLRLQLALQQALALAALVALGAAAILQGIAAPWLRAIPAGAAVALAFAGLARPGPGSAIAVLAAAVATIAASGLVWQATMVLALTVFFLVARWSPGLGSLREPVGRVPALATFACAAVTPGALAGWVALQRPDLHDLTEGLPAVHAALLVLGGVGFALINALCEEWIWRGVLQSRLTALFSPRVAVVAQAVSFGVAHAHGFPRGVVGVLLAATWAVMLGALRVHARGLLAPTLAHIVADATIAAIVLFWLR